MTRTRQILMGFKLGGVLVLAACSSPGSAGRSGVAAGYSFGRLKTELGPEVSVQTIAAAAERTLRKRGYSVFIDPHTEDRAVVQGRGPKSAEHETTTVESWVTKSGTVVEVYVSPWGDEGASYAILDEVLASIGR
ncbi:MAG: hypothetical protein KF745_10790 [Phycisphaeraceae bacterium]|nr:hypothetical protein [Phycisphaeraceae bacterium]